MLHAQGPIFSSHTWVVYSRGGGGYSRKGLFEYLELEKLTILSNLLERNCGQNLGLKRKLGGLGGGMRKKNAKNAGKQPLLRANKLFDGGRPPDAASWQV